VGRLAPLLLLAAFLVGGAAWFVTSLGAKPGASFGLVYAASVANEGDTSPGARHASAGTDTSRRSDSGRTAVTVLPEAPDGNEEVAAPAEVEDPAQIVGRVLTPEGQPCIGARVVAATGWVQALPFELEDLGQANSWIQRKRTVTDGQGRFAIEKGLQLGGEVLLHISAPGCAPLRLDRPPPGARGAALPLDYGDLQLRPGARVLGQVRDRGGNAMAGAEISLAIILGEQGFALDFPSRGVPIATSADDGTFIIDQLERGPFTLLVAAPGRVVARATGVASARPVENFNIVLESGSGIGGRLAGVDPAVELVGRVLRVEARPGKPDGSKVDGLERVLGGARLALIDEAGAFQVAGLVDGLPYTLIVTEQEPNPDQPETSWAWKRVAEVDPTEGSAGTRGLELRWNARRVAHLRVVDDATGNPVEACIIGWRDGKPGKNSNNSFRNLTEGKADGQLKRHFEGGRATIVGLTTGRAELEIAVKVIALGYETKTAENLKVRGEPTTDLGEVRLKPAPIVRVTVKVEETGALVEGAKVYLVKGDEQYLDWYVQNGTEIFGNEDLFYGVTGSDGVAVMPSMPGKRIKVSASSAEYVAKEPTEATLTIEGGDELTVQLAAGGTLLVRVRRPNGAPAPGVKVLCRKQELGSARNRFSRNRDSVTDESGVARFERLPIGMYEASLSNEVRGSGGGQQAWRAGKVALGEEATVVLDAPSTGTLTGLVTEAGQPLARTTLSLSTTGSDDNGDYGWGWDGQGASNKQATSRADGTFALGPVEAGEWILTVRHVERAMSMKLPVRIVEGVNTFDVRLDLALLEGRLVDEEGLPLSGLSVALSAHNEKLGGGAQKISMRESPNGDVEFDWGWKSLDQTGTDAEGGFQFRGVATARPLRLSISDRYVQSLVIELTDFADAELRDLGDIKTRAAGVIQVRYSGGSGNQSYRLNVVQIAADGSEHPDGDKAHRRGTNLRSRSWSTVPGLPPGRYRVEAVERLSEAVVATREVEVVARATVQVELE